MAKHEMGEQTIVAKEHIAEFNQYISNVNTHDQFYDGVYERVCKIGYAGKKNNALGIRFFICEQFQKHNIQIPGKKDNTETNIQNWLEVSPPNDSAQSRDNVYRMCFALEMNAVETEAFFLKSYLCRPFNFKDYKECVYYFCLNTKRTYSDAERLIAQMAKLTPKKVDKDKETRNIGIALSEIVEEEDFLKEMPKYLYEEYEQRQTITEAIIGLEKQCRQIANIEGRGSLLKAIYYDKQRQIGNKFLSREKCLDEEFPEYITTNFPLEITLSNIINHKIVTNDRCRKMLILLYFYKFYGEQYNLYIQNGVHYSEVNLASLYQQFEIALDNELNKCGFVELYYRNPYDAFFLSCAKKQDPLFEFRKMIDLKE